MLLFGWACSQSLLEDDIRLFLLGHWWDFDWLQSKGGKEKA